MKILVINGFSKRKLNLDGSIDKYKAQLVGKGFFQKENIDYLNTFAPVTRTSSIQILMVLASIVKLFIHQINVKITFQNADLEEEICMAQHEGCIISGQEK